MLGFSKRTTVFKPSVYQPGRRSRRMPRWLVLLLVGITLGAGGVLFLQANYGAPRLTAEQSEQLHSELSTANLDRQRLQGQLEETMHQHRAAQATHDKLTTNLSQAQQQIKGLNQDLQLFQAAVPPDPRGGSIGVRSAMLVGTPGRLTYQSLIMRSTEAAKTPFKGSLQFVVEGRHANGRTAVITPTELPISLNHYQNFSGTLALPEGFVAHAVTFKILDQSQKQQAMRVYYVRN